jgi:hypothetical protein
MHPFLSCLVTSTMKSSSCSNSKPHSLKIMVKYIIITHVSSWKQRSRLWNWASCILRSSNFHILKATMDYSSKVYISMNWHFLKHKSHCCFFCCSEINKCIMTILTYPCSNYRISILKHLIQLIYNPLTPLSFPISFNAEFSSSIS